jgi:hypothetical protein
VLVERQATMLSCPRLKIAIKLDTMPRVVAVPTSSRREKVKSADAEARNGMKRTVRWCGQPANTSKRTGEGERGFVSKRARLSARAQLK